MIEDHAVIPPLAVSPAEVLRLVLLHHQKNPSNSAAWLNLGLALRRMALYQVHDADHENQRLLESALESFDRSLQLAPDNTGKNIRAWIGQALTYKKNVQRHIARKLRFILDAANLGKRVQHSHFPFRG